MSRLKSKSVYNETYSYTAIRVPSSATTKEREALIAELEVFRKNYYGSETRERDFEIIEEEDGSTVYRFSTIYSMNGTDLHPGIHPDAVWAVDLVK